MSRVRTFFDARGYMEVYTPTLVASPGMEPNLSPLSVEVHPEGAGRTPKTMGLITSPEYSMKKLLGYGLPQIYTVANVFRDHEVPGQRWSIEFMMLEWYRQGADYTVMMDETELLVNTVLGKTLAWGRVSYVDAFENAFGFLPTVHDCERLLLLGKQHGLSLDQEPVHEMIDQIFHAVVVPTLHLPDAYFLCEYPVPCASLAKISSSGRYAERCEAFVNGMEIANGFTELTDGALQRARFEEEAAERRTLGKHVFPIDEDLLAQLHSVTSPTYGNALGLDRLVMLYAGVHDIDSIHCFPPSQRYS